jgi:alanine dehydrogenase
VPPGHVAILGSGVVGSNAAMIAVGLGARVTILGEDRKQLRRLQEEYGDWVTTLAADTSIVQETLCSIDLVIGAFHVVGSRTPLLVTQDMVSQMVSGSVVVDVSVDQGGCVETSHPTTHHDPVFDVGCILHYGVTNMPGIIPQTST